MNLEQPEDARPAADLKAKDFYETPDWYFNFHNAKYQFTLDACAVPATAKCADYYSLCNGQDSIVMPWSGRVWCNPPYSQILRWVKKGIWEVQSNPDCQLVFFLLPMSVDTQYFQLLYNAKADIITTRGRLLFLLDGIEKKSPEFSAAGFVVQKNPVGRWHHMDIKTIREKGEHINNLPLGFPAE